MSDIIYVKAEGSYSRIVLAKEKHNSFVIAFNMKTVANSLTLPLTKAHRSHIVNADRIRKFYGNTLVMDNGDEIPLGADYKNEIIGNLNVIKTPTK